LFIFKFQHLIFGHPRPL